MQVTQCILSILILFYQLSGDFNINAFQENGKLENVPSSYNQIITVSAHICGLLLDHVYMHQEFSKELHTQSVIGIYFIDHYAVKFRFVY